MFNIVNMYINKLTKDDVNNFALKKGANLSSEELERCFKESKYF